MDKIPRCSENAKELWKLVDWKGSVQEDDHNELSFQEIYNFFNIINLYSFLMIEPIDIKFELQYLTV